jgi:hypothetical protein
MRRLWGELIVVGAWGSSTLLWSEELMMKKVCFLALAFAMLTSAAARGQVVQVIGNFEGGSLDGWQGASDGSGGYGGAVPPNTVPALSSVAGGGIANTLGTNALRIAGGPGAQNFWAITLNDTNHPGLAAKIAAAAAGGGALKADVTFVASQFPNAAANWAQWNKISIQTTFSGWTEVNPAADPGWNAGLGNLTYTYSWPVGGINATAGTFANIIMSINYDRGAYSATNAPAFFVDNIRLEHVPEPGSLTLIGLGLAGAGHILRRRRG